MHIPEEIVQLIYMYSLRSIFREHPTLYSEMINALIKRKTYAHRVYRCKKVARLYMKQYEKRKLQTLLEG
jgi:hypothetical protein